MDKDKWINKMKNKENVIWIDSHKDCSKSAVEVVNELWDMYENDFNLTISEMCNILVCDRNWVIKYVVDNVKCIFIGNHMRLFMKKVCMDKEFIKDYYYFSRTDFQRWLKENTKAERQSIVIDMIEYANNEKSFLSLVSKYKSDKAGTNNMIDLGLIITKFNSDVYDYVNDKGKQMYSLRKREDKRNGCEFVNVDIEIPNEFTSAKELKVVFNNNERVYRSLFSKGAIKYTICESLVRFDKDYYSEEEGILDIVVPYKEYMLLI